MSENRSSSSIQPTSLDNYGNTLALKHLKLQKIIAGKQKRVFSVAQKTYRKQQIIQSILDSSTGKVQNYLSSNVNQKQYDQKRFFYGQYSSQLKTEDSSKQYLALLVDSKKVDQRYILQSKSSQQSYSQYINLNSFYNKKFFQNSFYDLQQPVQYFQANMETPLDAISVGNSIFFLMPLTQKNDITIDPTEADIQIQGYTVSADNKPGYTEVAKKNIMSEFQVQQYNVPIYDLKLSNVQTVQFSDLEALRAWVTKWFKDLKPATKLSSIGLKILCNVNNAFNHQYDSVNLSVLNMQIQQGSFSQLMTSDQINQMLKQLYANIKADSFISNLQMVGSVSKLDNKVKRQLPKTRFQAIPRNKLYVSSSSSPVDFGAGSTQVKPKQIFNFVSLKNMSSPTQEQQIDLEQLSQLIDLSDEQSQVASTQITNKRQWMAYDNDYSTSQRSVKKSSIESDDGQLHLVLNKKNIKKVLDQGIQNDLKYICDQTLSSQYRSYDQTLLLTKEENYLKPFESLHQISNKRAQMRQLHGLRTYNSTGVADGSSKLWLTYNYIASKSNDLDISYLSQFQLGFKEYEFNKNQRDMEQTYRGLSHYGIDDPKTTRAAGQRCPWQISSFNTLDEIQKRYQVCSACLSSSCLGYCSFPINGKYPDGTTGNQLQCHPWSFEQYKKNMFLKLSNQAAEQLQMTDQWMHTKFDVISGMTYSLVADSDIEVADDLQIIFTNMDFDHLKKWIVQSGNSQIVQVSSTFGGFGGHFQAGGDEKLLSSLSKYKLTQSDSAVKQSKYITMHISSFFSSVQEYTTQKRFISSDKAMLQPTSNGTIKLQNLFSRPLRDFIDSQFFNQNLVLDQTWSEALSTNLSKLIDQDEQLREMNNIRYSMFQTSLFIKGIQHLKTKKYYSLYTQSLFEFIKDLKIGPQKRALRDFPLNSVMDPSKTFLTFNGFAIADDCPFNGPHIINRGTQLSGLLVLVSQGKDDQLKVVGQFAQDDVDAISDSFSNSSQSDSSKSLPTINCYFRAVSWFSSKIKCLGRVRVQSKPVPKQLYQIVSPYTKIEEHVLSVMNNFQHLQKVEGMFIAGQNDFKKSNIYSIQLANTGLNPVDDVDKTKFLQYLLRDDYKSLPQSQRRYYNHLTYEQFKDLQRTNYTRTKKLLVLQSIANTSSDQKFIQGYSQDSENGALAWSDSIQKMSKAFERIRSDGGLYVFNQEYADRQLETRKKLRQTLQSAIQTSTPKYMPLHTSLWKIIYSGK